MAIAALLRRELITSGRRGGAIVGRAGNAVMTGLIVASCFAIWDGKGWDRSSVAGAQQFGLAVFALIVAAQILAVFALAPVLDFPAIAAERDRKSLDSLLATRISSAELVVGTIGAGLIRSINGLLGSIPLVVLVVMLGGVDLRLVLLAWAGLISTAVALASLTAAISAGAPTAARSVNAYMGLGMSWLILPPMAVMLLPRIWPAVAPWAVPPALWALDGSPAGILLSLVGAIPRGPLVDSVLRMVAIQAGLSAALGLWAITRLRPASRAIHDGEGRAARLRVIRGRWRPRPACGDDPVLWLELHPARGSGLATRMADRCGLALAIGLLAWATSWLAGPAFAELWRSGYGSTPGIGAEPELNPIARVLLAKLGGVSVGLAAGSARLEFNIALRQASWLLGLIYCILVVGYAAEGLTRERQRDTWLGLIATPLSGREILRAKMIGAIWKARSMALPMLGLWAVGLAAGAIHPIGFAAAVAGLAGSTWFLAAWGIFVASRSSDPGRAALMLLVPTMLGVGLGAVPFVAPGAAGVVVAAAMPPFQAWLAPLSYEDIAALARGGLPPRLAAVGVAGGPTAWLVTASWALSVGAQLAGAILLGRAAFRGFDAAVGRPVRGAKPAADQPEPFAPTMTLPGRIGP